MEDNKRSNKADCSENIGGRRRDEAFEQLYKCQTRTNHNYITVIQSKKQPI